MNQPVYVKTRWPMSSPFLGDMAVGQQLCQHHNINFKSKWRSRGEKHGSTPSHSEYREQGKASRGRLLVATQDRCTHAVPWCTKWPLTKMQRATVRLTDLKSSKSAKTKISLRLLSSLYKHRKCKFNTHKHSCTGWWHSQWQTSKGGSASRLFTSRWEYYLKRSPACCLPEE